MLIIEHSETTPADPAALWSRYVDVASWNRWDPAVESVRLDGPFAVGSRGVLKPKSGPATPFTLTAVQPQRGFTDVSQLPLARLTFTHVLEPVPAGTRFTHRIALDGPLAFLFARIMGPAMRAGLPAAMQSLATLAAAQTLEV